MSTTTTNLGLFKYDPATDGSSTFDLTQAINGPLDKIDAVLPISGVSRQAIINGGFSVNQRGVSGTVTLAAGQYGHDRWKAGSAGCTYTFSTANNVTTITISAGSLLQVIEGIHLYSGVYSLSWSGTSQGKIGGGSYGASGITATVVGGTNINVEFNAGTLSKVQFNAGGVVLPFQPRSFAEELQLCQRYYEKSYEYESMPGIAANDGSENFTATSSTFIGGKASFKVRKRIAPTVSIYAPVAGTSNVVNGSLDGSTFTVTSISTFSQTGITLIAGTGFTIGSLYRFQYTADAEL